LSRSTASDLARANFGQPAIRTEEERKILFGQTAAVVR